MPFLFFIAFIVLMTQYIIDKFLITYYYSYRFAFNDLLNRTVLEVIKYSSVGYLLFGGAAMTANNCAIENTNKTLSLAN